MIFGVKCTSGAGSLSGPDGGELSFEPDATTGPLRARGSGTIRKRDEGLMGGRRATGRGRIAGVADLERASVADPSSHCWVKSVAHDTQHNGCLQFHHGLAYLVRHAIRHHGKLPRRRQFWVLELLAAGTDTLLFCLGVIRSSAKIRMLSPILRGDFVRGPVGLSPAHLISPDAAGCTCH